MYGQLTLLAPQMDGRQEMKAKMETVWNILVKIENCMFCQFHALLLYIIHIQKPHALNRAILVKNYQHAALITLHSTFLSILCRLAACFNHHVRKAEYNPLLWRQWSPAPSRCTDGWYAARMNYFPESNSGMSMTISKEPFTTWHRQFFKLFSKFWWFSCNCNTVPDYSNLTDRFISLLMRLYSLSLSLQSCYHESTKPKIRVVWGLWACPFLYQCDHWSEEKELK